MQQSVNCVADDQEPLDTGEDGKEVLVPRRGIAAYESAATGRRVALPFTPPRASQERTGKKPIELWR